MARHRFDSLRAAAIAALVLLVPIGAYGDSSDARLQHVSSVVADDGSTRITLSFDKPVTETRVFRAAEHSVHVVVVGAELPSGTHPSISHLGEIEAANLGGFAGIGIQLDLHTHDRVTVRTEENGRTVIVHVPAPHSDDERNAVAAALAARPKPTPVPASDAQVTALVKLSYADVSEVAGALVKGAVVPSTDTFNAVSPFVPPPPPSSSFSSSSSSSSQAGQMPTYVSIPAATLLPKDTPQGVRFDEHVAVDRRLNAIIITGTPAQVDAYKALIAVLDVPTRSVLLETQIVELTETGAKDLGVDYSPNNDTLTTATFAAGTNNKPTFGLNISAAVAALEQTGQAKILARPRILALNNRPAAILSGEAVPIVNSIIVPGGSGTIVNQQVQYINVGVSLQILPRIAADGRVTTQIFCEVSSIINYAGNAPNIAVRQELTSAVVNDSESLIVGGLLQETEIKSLRKVPGLGNIPLLAGFFRDVANSSQNTNLYIVVTPHILGNGVGPDSSYDLPPGPLPTVPPADPSVVPGPLASPPPGPPPFAPPPSR